VTDTTTLQTLEHTLDQAIAGLAELASLLDEEHSALGEKDPARLESVVSRKVELLGAIEPGLVRLERQLGKLGLSAPSREAAERLAKHPDAHPIAGLWVRLHELSTKVERENLINGQLAQQRERATRAALAILTGRNNEDPTYNANGADRSKLAGYSLAKA
jgi:flagellar biosynthesis/type III secretory pathway chaperone